MKDGMRVGRHWIMDAWNSPAELLNDAEYIRQAVIQAVSDGGGNLIDICVHKFCPAGVTANATLAESHIAIHTWPEFDYFAADLFFCGKGDPTAAMKTLQEALQPQSVRVLQLERGIAAQEPGSLWKMVRDPAQNQTANDGHEFRDGHQHVPWDVSRPPK